MSLPVIKDQQCCQTKQACDFCPEFQAIHGLEGKFACKKCYSKKTKKARQIANDGKGYVSLISASHPYHCSTRTSSVQPMISASCHDISTLTILLA